MSLKDDFLEALRSVKKDFLRDYEYGDQQEQSSTASGHRADQTRTAAEGNLPLSDEEIGSLLNSTSDFRSGSEQQRPRQNAREINEDDIPADVDPTPYRSASGKGGVFEDGNYSAFEDPLSPNGGRMIFDELDDDESEEDRTVISKNTVIKGALQTEDSVRMFGQVLGDIDCKSNILVAGKVRGNTSAANAYIINAQVDGNLLCDDVINVTDDAWILGNIRAQQADIDGKIKGNIEIRHSISIGSNSSVIGNISTEELEIKRGAFVNGQVMMYSPSRDVIDRFDQFDQ